jgi:hypothetical protein
LVANRIRGIAASEIDKKLLEMFQAVEGALRAPRPHTNGHAAAHNGHPYEVKDGCLYYLKELEDSVTSVKLTNFTANIDADLVCDDGVERTRTYAVTASQNGHSATVNIPARDFPAMGWVGEALGAKAVLMPGMNLRDHARAAVQLLSTDIQQRTVYTHLGWRKLHGEWCYLHAGGALGAQGHVDGIDVQLETRLQNYTLQVPDDIKTALRASLKMLDVAPWEVTVPLYSSPWLSILGLGALTVFISGVTGQRKTQLCALVQQHFGASMNDEHLPDSWESSANSLEGLLFLCKDALTVVDEYVPTDSTQAARLHQTAERIIRAQANRSARGRMRADTTLRPPKPPRGLLLSSGEDIPKGHSLRARMAIVPVDKGSVNLDTLTACQGDAVKGLYAQATAGFIQWLAPQYEAVQARLPQELIALRTKATTNTAHGRTTDNTARLALGWQYVVQFAEHIGVLTPEEAEDYRRKGWNALMKVASTQAEYLEHAEPAGRFIDLVREALLRGKAHVTTEAGTMPAKAESLGWRQDGKGFHSPIGDRIGYLKGETVYLLPQSSYAVAQNMGKEIGDTIAVAPKTLNKRLREQGYLSQIEESQDKATVRKTFEGQRNRYLPISLENFVPPPPDKNVSNGSNVSPGSIPRAPNAVDTFSVDTFSPSGHISPENVSTRNPLQNNAENGTGHIGHIFYEVEPPYSQKTKFAPPQPTEAGHIALDGDKNVSTECVHSSKNVSTECVHSPPSGSPVDSPPSCRHGTTILVEGGVRLCTACNARWEQEGF